MKYYVLYNAIAGNGRGLSDAEKLKDVLDGESVYVDKTKLEDYAEFIGQLQPEDVMIICGGDGTLNRFVNDVKGLQFSNKVLYYACGSGNDFLRDIPHDEGKPVAFNEYMENLPTVLVNGKEYVFLNGVGYGIDGYCCEVGDKLRAEKPGQNINYAGIAIKGLLFHYKPTNATVIVDGKEYAYKKVWLAPTMYGRYYGGGMLPAPEQRRGQDNVSVMLFYGSGKLKTLMIFPSLFKGEHVKHTKNIAVFSGKEITVKFDTPRTLQIDGETVFDVSEYTVRR